MKFLLDLIFPKRCVGCKKLGQYFCDKCFAKISFNSSFTCPMCQKLSVNGITHPKCRKRYGIDGIIPVLSYNSIIKKAVYKFKYSPYISDMKSALCALMYEGLIQNESFVALSQHKFLMLPVPLSKSRIKERGYNQAELLSQKLSEKLFITLLNNALIRVKKTMPQFDLSKEKRFENIKNAFQIKPTCKKMIFGESIFLIDDVTTTGATLRECAKVLKRNGAEKVYGITLAKETY